MKISLHRIAKDCAAGDCSAPPTRVGISLQSGCTVVAWWCEDHAAAIESAQESPEDRMLADFEELIGEDDQKGFSLIMALVAVANEFSGRDLTARAMELVRRHPTMFTTLQDQVLEYVSSPEVEDEFKRRLSETETTKVETDES